MAHECGSREANCIVRMAAVQRLSICIAIAIWREHKTLRREPCRSNQKQQVWKRKHPGHMEAKCCRASQMPRVGSQQETERRPLNAQHDCARERDNSGSQPCLVCFRLGRLTGFGSVLVSEPRERSGWLELCE